MIVAFELPETQAKFILEQLKDSRLSNESDLEAVSLYCFLLCSVVLSKEQARAEKKAKEKTK